MNKPNRKYDELANRLEQEIDEWELSGKHPVGHPKKFEYIKVIAMCRKQAYHDFLSELATPKLQMINDLKEAGLEDEAKLVMEGYYDE